MPKEIVFVLNVIEKQMAEELIQKMESGSLAVKKQTNNTNDIRSEISYEYRSAKQEKILSGAMLDCPYKLRYRDSNRIFFSAWGCKDVCSVFYDVIMVIHVMNRLDVRLNEVYEEFEVDLNVESYVFLAGPIAASFVDMSGFLDTAVQNISHNSQYILSTFQESNHGVYGALLEKLKAEGYSDIRILQAWIRGEILYYAVADGVILRPQYQRTLSPKEEEDLIRKIYKAMNSFSSTLVFDPKTGLAPERAKK
ncbi:MAG: hypothetical protein LBU16_09615 [Treponema sp.]|jgi:hypothetical protein|nr:hypothetical protein [Treponema sp.]